MDTSAEGLIKEQLAFGVESDCVVDKGDNCGL